MTTYIADVVDLFEEFSNVEFFKEPDADAKFEHCTDCGRQRSAGNKPGAVGGQFGAIDPIAEDHAIEQASNDRYFSAQWLEECAQPGMSGLNVADLAPDEELQIAGLQLIHHR